MVSLTAAGMTKVKVGKEDQSSNEFVEKRRSALERYDEEERDQIPAGSNNSCSSSAESA